MNVPLARLKAAVKDHLWYKDAIIYQLHVKSFFDSNKDGIGDFPGLVSKLDYIADLGATAIWLLPFYPSSGSMTVTTSAIIAPSIPTTERWPICAISSTPPIHAASVSLPSSSSITRPIGTLGSSGRAAPGPARPRVTFMSGRTIRAESDRIIDVEMLADNVVDEKITDEPVAGEGLPHPLGLDFLETRSRKGLSLRGPHAGILIGVSGQGYRNRRRRRAPTNPTIHAQDSDIRWPERATSIAPGARSRRLHVKRRNRPLPKRCRIERRPEPNSVPSCS